MQVSEKRLQLKGPERRERRIINMQPDGQGGITLENILQREVVPECIKKKGKRLFAQA